MTTPPALLPGNYVAPFGGEKPTQSTFRGTWQPTLYTSKPGFNAFQFLPTPPPQKPRVKAPPAAAAAAAAAEAEAAPAAAAAAAPADDDKPKEDVAAADDDDELLTGPPIAPEDVLFSVVDREKNYRSCVAKDGTCTNNRGKVIGYLNFDSHEAGSAEEEYLGAVLENKFDNVYFVKDAADEIAGYIDMGTANIRDAGGSTVADLQVDGVVKHANGTYLGQFRGREFKAFHRMRECALYLMLLDPGMLSDVSG